MPSLPSVPFQVPIWDVSIFKEVEEEEEEEEEEVVVEAKEGGEDEEEVSGRGEGRGGAFELEEGEKAASKL